MSRNCFVPGCREGYKSKIKINKWQGIIKTTMFKAPKDLLLLEKWVKAIPRADRELRPGIDSVCEKHFDETYLNRYFETKSPDGSINQIKRDRIILKNNAIPSIFPDLPQYLTKKRPIEKIIAEKKILFNNYIPNTIDDISNTTDHVSETFNNLHDILKNMSLPDGWFFTYLNRSLVLGNLDSNYELIKKIIVSNNDLNLKVFIRNKLINITCTSVTCIEDITKVLKIVDDFVMCPGTGIDNCPKSDQCCEHINLISLNQVRNPRCTECAKKRKYFMDTQRVSLEQINEKPTTKPVLKNVLRINKRLNIKVTNLQAKVGLLKQQCAEASAKSIEEAIIEMPENQQEAVRTCFAAAKKHNVKGNRYTINWIYECLLIRIKSKKVYEHLRSKKTY
ncbi:uncharacterized protein LOC107885227 isoform X1 [Acyrthosiphon pisum]|uniref:THAP-type domain-containing protein n=1 Tax=Acyrthosiphon pisum TaxID=7029 RepID=A0A8R2JVS7_ACYPI|nr:uncharacterized protein LOC107885227 isoform X1 [Acyrthosiphon pisum]